MFIDSVSVFQLKKMYFLSLCLSAIVAESVPVLLITSLMGQPSTSSASALVGSFFLQQQMGSII